MCECVALREDTSGTTNQGHEQTVNWMEKVSYFAAMQSAFALQAAVVKL